MIIDINQVPLADIIVIDSTTQEAIAIRNALEVFGIQTRIHYIGNVKHLLSLLASKNYLHKIVIICCHGEQENLFIPELAPELEDDMPYHKILTPQDLSKILDLDNQIVINTGCCLGNERFAEVFLAKGCEFYIGSIDYIEGNAPLLFVTTLFYFQFCKNMSLEQSFDKASSVDDETKLFKLWHRPKFIFKPST